MNKYPQNNSIGLGRVANIEGDIGKVNAAELLIRVNELLADELIEQTVGTNITLDLSRYRTYKITLSANITITLVGLDIYKEAYIVVDPKQFSCTIINVIKETTETTIPYNHTLYKFYSPYQNIIELIEKTTNMYGIRPGEFESSEFEGSEFLI